MSSTFLLLVFLFVKPLQSLEYNEIWMENQTHSAELHKTQLEYVSDTDTIFETYEKAVQAYLLEDWDICIQIFHKLIYKYKRYKNALIDCRIKCHNEMKVMEPIFQENIEDLCFYEKKIKETLCLLTCNQEYRELAGQQVLKRLPLNEERKLIRAEHYGYLHNCYYQKKYYQDAANAVFTYLMYHPNHKASRASLAYYVSLPGVDNNKIVNLEAESFVQYYVKGVKAYEVGYYYEAIKNLEKSLDYYLESEQRCRFYCEGPLEQNWNPDFTTAVANHFVYNLRCKRRCSRVLNTLNGVYRRDLLANHLNYLQFAYYKLGNLEETCKAVESYLLFYPADEIMLSNKEYYKSLPTVNEDFFNTRQDCVLYVKRQEYEKRLLLYVQDKFEALEKKIMTSENGDISNKKEYI